MYDGVWRYDAVGRRVSLHHLEFNGAHASADHEGVITVNRPVGLHEVGLQVNLEKVSGDKGKHISKLTIKQALLKIDFEIIEFWFEIELLIFFSVDKLKLVINFYDFLIM